MIAYTENDSQNKINNFDLPDVENSLNFQLKRYALSRLDKLLFYQAHYGKNSGSCFDSNISPLKETLCLSDTYDQQGIDSKSLESTNLKQDITETGSNSLYSTNTDAENSSHYFFFNFRKAFSDCALTYSSFAIEDANPFYTPTRYISKISEDSNFADCQRNHYHDSKLWESFTLHGKSSSQSLNIKDTLTNDDNALILQLSKDLRKDLSLKEDELSKENEDANKQVSSIPVHTQSLQSNHSTTRPQDNQLFCSNEHFECVLPVQQKKQHINSEVAIRKVQNREPAHENSQCNRYEANAGVSTTMADSLYQTEMPFDFTTIIPRDENGELLSVGSIYHSQGTCKPCAFHHSTKKLGCHNGISCFFCHYIHPKKKKKSRPTKQQRLRLKLLDQVQAKEQSNNALTKTNEFNKLLLENTQQISNSIVDPFNYNALINSPDLQLKGYNFNKPSNRRQRNNLFSFNPFQCSSIRTLGPLRKIPGLTNLSSNLCSLYPPIKKNENINSSRNYVSNNDYYKVLSNSLKAYYDQNHLQIVDNLNTAI